MGVIVACSVQIGHDSIKFVFGWSKLVGFVIIFPVVMDLLKSLFIRMRMPDGLRLRRCAGGGIFGQATPAQNFTSSRVIATFYKWSCIMFSSDLSIFYWSKTALIWRHWTKWTILSNVIHIEPYFIQNYGDYRLAQLPDWGAPVQVDNCANGRRLFARVMLWKTPIWLLSSTWNGHIIPALSVSHERWMFKVSVYGRPASLYLPKLLCCVCDNRVCAWSGNAVYEVSSMPTETPNHSWAGREVDDQDTTFSSMWTSIFRPGFTAAPLEKRSHVGPIKSMRWSGVSGFDSGRRYCYWLDIFILFF